MLGRPRRPAQYHASLMRIVERINGFKWLKFVAGLVAAVLVVWGGGWLLVPPILKSQLEQRVGEKLGRQLSIGHIDFKPWTLELTVRDIVLAGADGQAPQLRIEQLYVDAELQSVFRLGAIVDAVTLDKLQLRLTHLGDGRYDIDDIVARLAPAPGAPAGDPLRFALYNLSLRGGSVDYVDKPVGKTHTLRDLVVGVPFLSNLSSDRQVQVEPRLAFQLNGSGFDSAAQSTPFTEDRKTQAKLKIADLDLGAYLGYWPAGLPFKLQAGVLNADLAVHFAQSPKVSVQILGQVRADGLRVTDAGQKPLLSVDRLALALEDVRPLERVVKLAKLEVAAPQIDLRREADGSIAWLSGAAGPTGATAPTPVNAGSAPAQPADAALPWQFALAQFAVRDGIVRWSDQAVRPGVPPVALQLQGLDIDVDDVGFPFSHPLRFKGSAVLGAMAGDAPSKASAGAGIRFEGSATDQLADARLGLERVPLGLGASYMAQFLAPSVAGQLSADLDLQWKTQDGPVVTVRKAAVEGLALTVAPSASAPSLAARGAGAKPLWSVRNLQVETARFDLKAQSLQIARVAVDTPRGAVERGADGRWMAEHWLTTAPAAGAPSAPAAGTSPPAEPARPWTWSLAALELDAGAISYRDQSLAQPVGVELSAIRVRGQGLSSDEAKAAGWQLSARVGSGEAEPGRLDVRGQVAMRPLVASGQVEFTQLPLHAFEPYFGEALNVHIGRADTGFKGAVRYAAGANGPTLRVEGDLAIEEFRAQSRPSGAGPGPTGGRELLNWKALNLRGLDVALAPGAATSVNVRETALSDFYARIIVNENGRINLQDLVKAEGAPPTDPAAPPRPTEPPVAQAASANSSAKDPVIRFGPISLLNGRVLFSDRFIQPNYTANLTELNGKLSAFASTPPAPPAPAGSSTVAAPQLADLELRGRAEGTASLEILGKLNPLAKPLALDIRGKVRDLELPPLSPYAVKYAGHGIERGKMSVDVHYEVQPDGRLTATNSLVLNQLTFGEPVAGAPASLPVRLAVALLADRNGVIDLDLPISGSLNDPQFRIGPVIWKIIGNLIAKAVTSPFSLLASAFGGGGEELGVVGFAPGSAALDASAEQRLDKVAKALTDRPALKMSVVGLASLEAERAEVKRERLQRMVRAEKRRNALAGGASVAASAALATGAAPAVVVSDAEYPELLKSLYKRAEFAKPRNAIGFAKDLPVAEMEALLLADMTVTEDTVRQLAVQRGVAVRDYLASKKVPLERLFLGAAKTVLPEADWVPHADLSLAMP